MRKLIKERVLFKESKLVDNKTNHLVTQRIKNTPHESAVRQVSGSARYVDDIPAPANLAHAAVGISNVVSGHIHHVDLSKVLASEGVIDVIVAQDVPGHIDIGPIFEGDPVLAHEEIKFHGQPIFAVLAHTVEQARMAASLAEVEITASVPILTIAQAE
ncbi:MAG: xanthine dehydrogenase large subunit, partial [Gammaproteobacteria bacterium]